MSKILPFENYKLTTNFSPIEIQTKILDNIEPKRSFRLTTGLFYNDVVSKPYEGEVIADSFKINRIINYRNSFLPIIIGQVSPAFGKTEISIKMRPANFVVIFMIFWLGCVGLTCLGIIIAGILNYQDVLKNGFSPGLLVPFAMFIAGWAMVFFGFKVESKKSKAFLAQLLKAEEVSN